CLGDYGDPCENSNQCADDGSGFKKCLGGICCRNAPETDQTDSRGKYTIQCSPGLGGGWAGLCAPGTAFNRGFGCRRTGCNMAGDRVFAAGIGQTVMHEGIVSRIQPSFCDIFVGTYDNQIEKLPNVEEIQITLGASQDVVFGDRIQQKSNYGVITESQTSTTTPVIVMTEGTLEAGPAAIRGVAINIVSVDVNYGLNSIKDTATSSWCPSSPDIYMGTNRGVATVPTDLVKQSRYESGQFATQLFQKSNPEFEASKDWIKVGTYGSCSLWPESSVRESAYTAYSHEQLQTSDWPQEAIDNAGAKTFFDKYECAAKVLEKDNMEIGECGELWGDTKEAVDWLGGIDSVTGELETNPSDEAMYRYQLSQCKYDINCNGECIR
ncbi:MAG: hypothetical protein VYA95_07290, partial [Candidatus Thermoplasmatota archaeon]|nr:hypothetical protein [Candidatus Thermoplasmatota archaeon]